MFLHMIFRKIFGRIKEFDPFFRECRLHRKPFHKVLLRDDIDLGTILWSSCHTVIMGAQGWTIITHNIHSKRVCDLIHFDVVMVPVHSVVTVICIYMSIDDDTCTKSWNQKIITNKILLKHRIDPSVQVLTSGLILRVFSPFIDARQ